MKKIIPFLALALLLACKSKSEKTLTMDTPTEAEVFQHGDSVIISGDLKTNALVYDEGIVRVYNQETGEKLLEKYFNLDYRFALANNFDDTTQLEVQLYLQKDGAAEEEFKKKVTVTCLP